VQPNRGRSSRRVFGEGLHLYIQKTNQRTNTEPATPLVTHQVGRPPPRSALAESLLGLLSSAQAEAGYRQQEADSNAL